jgi:hypothetical protein
LPERADPADDIAGRPAGECRLAQLCPLCPEGGRRRFQRQLPAYRHDRHGEAGVGGDDEGLEHLVGIEGEGGGSLAPVVALTGHVFELVHRERDASRFEGANRGSHASTATLMSLGGQVWPFCA